MSLMLRLATASDCRPVWVWRNDPQTRAMFRTHDVVPWEDHERWFAEAISDPSRLFLIADCDGIPCAAVRFDFGSACTAEISINLAPQFRGRHLAPEILRQATDLALQRWQHVVAVILPGNIASLKSFLAAGYAWEEPLELVVHRA